MAMMAIAILSFTFTACSDDDEPSDVIYSCGFDAIESSSPGFLADMTKIESAFKSVLDITELHFTKKGSVEECDKQVKAACEKAVKSLEGEVWKGTYTFVVTNVNTGKVVFSVTFKADNENFL